MAIDLAKIKYEGLVTRNYRERLEVYKLENELNLPHTFEFLPGGEDCRVMVVRNEEACQSAMFDSGQEPNRAGGWILRD